MSPHNFSKVLHNPYLSFFVSSPVSRHSADGWAGSWRSGGQALDRFRPVEWATTEFTDRTAASTASYTMIIGKKLAYVLGCYGFTLDSKGVKTN